MEQNQETVAKEINNFKESKYATGKRKTSIAKVWLKKGSGKIIINGKNFEDYFKRANHKMQVLRPFEIPLPISLRHLTSFKDFRIKFVASSDFSVRSQCPASSTIFTNCLPPPAIAALRPTVEENY